MNIFREFDQLLSDFVDDVVTHKENFNKSDWQKNSNLVTAMKEQFEEFTQVITLEEEEYQEYIDLFTQLNNLIIQYINKFN